MADARNVSVVVLAGGEGYRLRCAAAGDSCSSTPKQYRVLDGRESMLQWTLRRAMTVAARGRVLVVVTRGHRRWWHSQLSDLPAHNVVIQPCNRGTTLGILLPLLVILARDPAAEILILPSDHHVEEESLLCDVLRAALELAHRCPARVVLVGVTPHGGWADYGWIVPGLPIDDGPARTVAAFREKPDRQTVERFIERGALVNSLMIASRGQTLLELIAETAPSVVGQMQGCFREGSIAWPRIDRLYPTLNSLDFSRHVLEPRPERLLVQPATVGCGWCDLGTPERLENYLATHPAKEPPYRPSTLSRAI